MTEITTRPSPWRRARLAIATLLAAGALAVPIAWASDLFTDVPDSNPFHADIGAVYYAGITSGKTCTTPGTPPTFCPSEPITREAMAAFVHRGFGRIARAFSPSAVTIVPGPSLLTTAQIDVGGVAGRIQYVHVIGTVTTTITSMTGCPCRTAFVISTTGPGIIALGSIMNDSIADGVGVQTASIDAVMPVAAGASRTFQLLANLGGGAGTVTGTGTLTAVTVPFGASG